MARKRRKEEVEEEYVWKAPEFNEKQFLEKDILGTKSLMVTALGAIIFGIICWAIGSTVSEALGFLLMIIGGIVAHYVLLSVFNVDRTILEKKTVAGNVILYIFLTLGIWIMLLNPPFK